MSQHFWLGLQASLHVHKFGGLNFLFFPLFSVFVCFSRFSLSLVPRRVVLFWLLEHYHPWRLSHLNSESNSRSNWRLTTSSPTHRSFCIIQSIFITMNPVFSGSSIKAAGDKLLMNKFIRQNFGGGRTLKSFRSWSFGSRFRWNLIEGLRNVGSATRLFFLW